MEDLKAQSFPQEDSLSANQAALQQEEDEQAEIMSRERRPGDGDIEAQ